MPEATNSYEPPLNPHYRQRAVASGAKADDPDAVVKESLTTQADGRISK